MKNEWALLTIKAVLFDMGGTLIKYDVVHAGEIFQRILVSLGISRSLDEIKTAFVNAGKEAKDLNLLSSFGKMECEEYWNQWDSLVLKHLGIAEYAELAKTVQSKWFDFVNFTLHPEVRDVLITLQQRGLKLGLISTAYEEEIHFILEKVNFEKATFDIIVGVDTIKKFIGDNVEADYKGAESVGIHALLIDRTEKTQSGLRTISNLREILSRID